MIILILSTPLLSPGFTLDAADWQISTDPSFSNEYIVVESLGDIDNKNIKIFKTSLDPRKKYYARARHVFNKFIAEWSDIDVIEVDETDDIGTESEIPAVVSIPEVTLDFDLNNVPNSFFTITTTPMSSTTNAKHIATNYTITDISGEIYFSSLGNTRNLNKLIFRDIVLESNKTYILAVSHICSSGDISDEGKIVFNVPDVKDINIISSLDLVKGNDIYLDLEPINNLSTVYIDFYAVGLNDIDYVNHSEFNTTSITLFKSLLEYATTEFVIGIKVKYIDGNYSKVKYFKINAY